MEATRIKKVFGKIILVDDEKYEKTLLELALLKKRWDIKIEYYKSAKQALDYLKTTKEEIFLIISDWHMPELTGLGFKKAIDSDFKLRKKTVPFIFFSSASSDAEVGQAFEYRVQGFFNKPLSIEEQAHQIDLIIQYWIISRQPHDN